MNLLLITDRMPYPPNGGGKITMWNLVRRLSAMHRVTLLSFYDGPGEVANLAPLRHCCTHLELVPRRHRLSPGIPMDALRFGSAFVSARNRSPKMRAAIAKVLRDQEIDVVQVETFYMMQHLPARINSPVVLDMHNITWRVWERAAAASSGLRSRLYRIEANRTEVDELVACRKAHLSVVVSQDDLEILRDSAPDVRACVIQPGVDTEALKPGPEIGHLKGNNLVFVGTLGYLPNSDAIQYFSDAILPSIAAEIPDVRVSVIGKYPRANHPPAVNPRIAMLGSVEDVAPYIRQSVTVVPLRIGGGIRMKILEAMALGSPIVTTSIGCEGLGLRHGEHALVADSPRDFSKSVVELLRNEPLRRQLAAAARRKAVRDHSWEIFIQHFNQVYEELTTASRAGVWAAVPS